jgi:peroxiredoxin
MKYKVGDRIGKIHWSTIDASPIHIPDLEGRIVHLQFSRWAGCPICNMHVASFRRRAQEIERAGIVEVMVFHSPAQDIRDLRGDLPFALVADPSKVYYKAFGVQQSPFFLFHPRAFRALRSEAKQGNKAQRIHGGVFGLPADFVIDPTGRLIAAHYGQHADDSLSVDQILTLAGRGQALSIADKGW